MGDNISNIHGSVIATRGGKAIVHGDFTSERIENYNFQGAILNFRNSLMQYIIETEKFSKLEKNELERLVFQLADVLHDSPPEKKEEVETIIEIGNKFVAESTRKRTNKSLLNSFAAAFKKAAKNISDALPKVLDITNKIIGIIAKLAL